MAPPHKTSQSDQEYMKHNLLKSLIISVILLTGVSNAWGYTISSAKVYYDDSNSQWSNNVVIAFDKGYKDSNSKAGGAVFAMTKIDNTSLYYWSGTWGDEVVSYMRFGKTTQTYNWYEWGDYAKSTWDLSTHDSWDGVSNGWGLDINNASVLFGATSADKGADLTKTDLSGYSALNSIQTIKTAVDGADANSKATISITSYEMTGDGSATERTASITSGAQSTTISAARTATTTLTVGTVAIGYKFDGWYAAATGGTALSTSTTYTYYPTAATTVYARFSAQPSTTIYLEPTGYWNSHNPQYVAHVWNTSVNKDIIMEGVGDSPHRYYKAEVPYGYTNVVFYRKSTEGTTIWNQTADLQFPTNDNVLYTITSTGTYKKGDDGYEAAGGNWKVANLVYTVTLAGTDYGTYKVTYGEQQPITVSNQTRIIDVAAGTQLTITNIVPKTEGYDQTMVYSAAGANYTYFSDSTEIDGKRTYTYIVNSDVTIAEDFRTKNDHVFYLKVTAKPFAYWCASDNEKEPRIMWTHRLNQEERLYNEENLRPFIKIKEENAYNIYRVTIPAGFNTFCIYACNQFKSSKFFRILPDDPTKNCYELTNEEVAIIDNIPSTNGHWIASKVYLDPNAYCTYGITCNDKDTYLNHATEERMIELPFGASLKIVDAYDISPYYMANPRYATSVVINRGFEANKEPLPLYDEIRYSANVVTKETQRVYLHLPSNLKNEWINGTTGNDWFNCIYLRDYLSYGRTLDPEHNGSNVEYGKVVKGFSHESFDANEDEYWYIDIPAGFNAFGFERKNSTGQGTGFANRTIEFEYEIPLDGVDNCFTINSTKVDGRFEGTWGSLPNCTITLGYCEFGTHGIKYNGQEYFASNDEKTNVEIVVPYGAEVEVLAGRPLSDAYTNHVEQWIDKNPNDNNSYDTKIKTFDKFDGVKNKVTITEKTLFDDCFLTKEPHDVYIGIPNTGMDDIWYKKIADQSNNNALVDGDIYVWPLAQNVGQSLAVKTDKFENDGVTYYKFTLPAGINNFRFERKAYNGNGTTYCRSKNLTYEIPLNEENCYMLDKGKTPDSHYTGYWTSMPANEDFRILYVEQIVTKKEQVGDEWITEVKRTYEHSSDIIKKRNTSGSDIVSLHIYTRGKNPEIILQQYDESTKKWKDIEAHMVNGPLETNDPGMGLLPGRKNASPGSDKDDFVYDDGIEKIKNDPTDDGCGVWNFTVYQDGTSAKLDLINESGLKRYEGKYYIRTANTEGKWIDYTIPANHMTFSPYAKQHHGEYFSHYFCKWVDLGKHYRDVSFMIANDYAKSLTDPSYLFEDQYVDNQWLPGSTNIRWGWSIINNKVSRAYIAGSYNGDNKFLVVKGQDEKVTLQANINGFDGYFNDNTNWLYYADLLAQPEAQVIVRAKYNGDYQYFMGKSDQYQKLIGGDFANDKRYYPIRILYDFKEHRFVVGYHPETQIEGKDVAIETPVMLIREHHNAPNQISFDNTERTIEAPMPAYGVITFLEEKLIDSNIPKNEKMFYWVSFPFDVRISHVFGLGEYGSHWVMEEYDGEARAEEGWNIYNTFWKYITDTATTLYAGKGYVLCLNYNRVINEAFLSDAAYEKISLYFPSIEEVDQSTIKKQDPKNITIPTWTGAAPQKDHNWNLIGAISYANTGETTQQSNAKFLYEYQPKTDTYSPKSSHSYTFNALHAYMVQYGGIITWNNFIAPQSIAAKRDTDSDNDIHALSLDLICNGTVQDQTFIQLEDGEATQMFDLNIDMTKIINSGSNIYSFSTDNNKLAGSVLPIEEAIIPLGVVSAAAGEYTFAMPEGTDGIVVELIDYETNTRTNMLLDNYTVNLGKGTFETRFALHVKPSKVTTSVEDINTNSNGVKKYLIDGILYMQKDGVLYDAQGKLVR